MTRPDIEAIRRLARGEIEAHGPRDLCGYALRLCDYLEEIEAAAEREAIDLGTLRIDLSDALGLREAWAAAETEPAEYVAAVEELKEQRDAAVRERDEARVQIAAERQQIVTYLEGAARLVGLLGNSTAADVLRSTATDIAEGWHAADERREP